MGHDEAGDNLAGLYSLVATCEANGLNPLEYLADVLIRVNTQPNKQIDELLPHLWNRSAAAAARSITTAKGPGKTWRALLRQRRERSRCLVPPDTLAGSRTFKSFPISARTN